MKKQILYFVIFLLALFSCSGPGNNTGIIQEEDVMIIPKPLKIETRAGYYFIEAKTKLFYDEGDTVALEVLEYFKELIYTGTDYNLEVEAVEPGKFKHGGITFSRTNAADSLGEEGYCMYVKRKKIEITAQTPTGLFYAVQTLRQLLPPEIELPKAATWIEWKIPCVNIIDYPRFEHRGMLLDCCRHFMEKNFVKRYIDLLAYHKMNILHWHLTEDQGWRIEIKKYPKLTETGAWRNVNDSTKYGGFYTQADIKEVVEYAKTKHIEIIPEIEMPGHSLAALAGYPQFSCTGGPFEVETNWGVFKDIYCAGNDSTFIFLKDILDEVIELFPSEYIHIGGDEAPKFRWENCEKCQTRIKAEGLKDEHELQSWFITEIEKYLNSKGKKLIGWDEILEGGLAPSATVQSWRGMEGAVAAATSGHDAIVSPTSHAYFDYDVKTTDLEKVYAFEPVPDELTKEEAKHILGGECNMWTERAPQETIDSKMFPRMLAMSEVLWSPNNNRSYDEFYNRVQKHYDYLDQLEVHYGFEKNPVGFDVTNEGDYFKIELISGQENIELFYTVDGSIPTQNSEKYNAPINIAEKGILKVIAVQNGKEIGDFFSREFVDHIGIGKAITLTNPFSDHYPAGGENALFDGYRGTNHFRDNLWQGFQFKDMEVVIDFGEKTDFTKVTIGFLQSVPSWIFMPTEIELSVSETGNQFITVGKIMNDVSEKNMEMITKDYTMEFYPKKMRYLKIIAKNQKYCPDWHPGAGGEAWIFCDEIIIE